MIIEAKGTIIEGDEEKRTVKIRLDDDDKTEIELKIDKDTDISSGYFPEKGDIVKIRYDKDTMLLKDIQLVNRAEDKEDSDSDK